MTTDTPAPASVPDEYNSEAGMTIFQAGTGEVGLYLHHVGVECLDPQDADDLADALKAHAAAAEEGRKTA